MSNEAKKKHEQLAEHGDELSLALGRAIWAFSKIERLTYEYLKALSNEPLDVLMVDQPFKSRIKLIKQLVERLAGQHEDKAFALRQINKAESLADIRNMIAHNPWCIWIDFETKSVKSEIQKYHKREKKHDLSSICKFTEDAQKCASSLENALCRLRFMLED
jgi:hypothetical protein